MTISFVGSNVALSTGTFLPTNLSLPASIQDDLVLVFSGCHDGPGVGSGAPTTPGYTAIATIVHSAGFRLNAYFKFMGATPDTSVSFPPTQISGTSLVATALVFRGCFLNAQPQDVPPVIVDAGTTPVLAGPIRPPRADGLTVIAATGIPGDATVGSVSGFLPSPSVQGTIGPITVAAAYRIAVGGAATTVTPGPWSTWGGGFQDRFVAITIAIRAILDVATVTKASVAFACKTVTVKEITPVSRAQVAYTGKVVTIPGASIDIIFVDKYKIALTGKIVTPTDVGRTVTITQSSVLYRGGIVDPRETTFEDVPYFTVKGRGSEVFMETR